MIGLYVVLRTEKAGVHVGVLRRLEISQGLAVAEVTEARRIWQWKGGRNTLHEISLRGVGSESKVSEMIDRIMVFGVIEVLPCTGEAERNLRAARWSN